MRPISIDFMLCGDGIFSIPAQRIARPKYWAGDIEIYGNQANRKTQLVPITSYRFVTQIVFSGTLKRLVYVVLASRYLSSISLPERWRGVDDEALICSRFNQAFSFSAACSARLSRSTKSIICSIDSSSARQLPSSCASASSRSTCSLVSRSFIAAITTLRRNLRR